MNPAAKTAKLALLGAFILRPAAWDARAEGWSRLLPHDWPGEHSAHLGEMVSTGRAQMLELLRDGERIGFLVYEIDRDFAPPEFVILAAYSGDARVSVTAHCLPEIEATARAIGCATIRFHTMRPGLIARARAAGFRVSEVIARKDIRHG